MKYSSLDKTPSLATEYLLGDEPLRIPRGDITVCFGEGASGKGRLTAAVIKRVTAAGGTVVGAWPEDHPCEQLRPRLEAAGLTEEEMARVINITRLPGGGRFKLSADQTHDGDVTLLRTEILPELKAAGHDVRMLVLDPLAALIGWGSVQTNAGARRALEPVQDLCQDTGIAAWIIAHTTKAGALQGSAGLLQAVRLAYRLTKDGEERVLTAEKANNLPTMEPIRFAIMDAGDGNAKVVFLSFDDIQARQASWRTQEPTVSKSAPFYTSWYISQNGSNGGKSLIAETSDLGTALRACTQHPQYGKSRGWKNHVRKDRTVNPNALMSQIVKGKDGEGVFMICANHPISTKMLREARSNTRDIISAEGR